MSFVKLLPDSYQYREFVGSSYLLRICFGLYSWDSWKIRDLSVTISWSNPNSKSPNELRMLPNQIRFSYDVQECTTNLLRIRYGVFQSGVRGRNFEPFKTLVPKSRLTYELQELTTIYKIQLRTSRIDYESATNPKIYQFVGFVGNSARSGIPPLVLYLKIPTLYRGRTL